MSDVNRVAGAIQEVIRRNLASTKISTGDESADAAYTLGVSNVIEDLELLLVEVANDSLFAGPARPFIPASFRIHSVATH